MPQTPVAGCLGSIFVEPEDERLLEIVEVGSFAADAADILTEEQIEALKQEVAYFRQLGSVIEGTGGLRKLRFGAKGRGKRGGARVLYYYGGDHMPLFLIAIYPKSVKENISAAEKKAIKKLINCLAEEYGPDKLRSSSPESIAGSTSPQLKLVKSAKGKRT
jgi:hypothetical protein